MDIGKALSFVFEDPNWAGKIIIGGILAIIPVVGWVFVMGYMIAVARNVIQGNPQPLPEWSDFGQLFIDGLYGLVIAFVYVLPIIIFACIFVIPLSILAGDGSGSGGANFYTLVMLCFSGFAVIYGILVGWLFIPAALGRYADTNDLASALRFNEVLDISRADPVAFLIALLIAWLASFLASFGLILCCIGVIFTSFYAQCVTGHVYGQAYARARAKAI
jgi:hypothetical protein